MFTDHRLQNTETACLMVDVQKDNCSPAGKAVVQRGKKILPPRKCFRNSRPWDNVSLPQGLFTTKDHKLGRYQAPLTQLMNAYYGFVLQPEALLSMVHH